MTTHSLILVAAQVRRSSIEERVLRDDRPVSGGVGAVLARGGGVHWSSAADAALLAADPAEISDTARALGVSLSTAQTRQAALERRISEMMA
ncbi:MAG: hypothetical protein AB7S99_05015 [Pseudodonghicola sp.]